MFDTWHRVTPEEFPLIDVPFNGLVVEGFLCGMYTLIFFQALLGLFQKGNKGCYSCTLILLWIFVLVTLSGDWVIVRGQYTNDYSYSLGVLHALQDPQSNAGVVTLEISIIVSQAILIWQCNMLWNNSYILVILAALLVTTAGCMLGNIPSAIHPFSKGGNLVTSLTLISATVTTLLATSLAAWRIVVVTRQSHMRRSYFRVVEILIESAALVCFVLLAIAIIDLIGYVHPFNLRTIGERVLFEVSWYLWISQGPITGIAPTLIALRVTHKPPQTEANSTSRSGPLSQLRFIKTTQGFGSNSRSVHAWLPSLVFSSLHVTESSMVSPMDVETETGSLAE